MRKAFALTLLAATVSACGHVPGAEDPRRGLSPVNVPVVHRTDYVFDAATPSGMLPPEEAARLDSWFRGLDLGYGDIVFVDGLYADGARADVARIAGQYGMLVTQGAPVTAGRVADGMVRVVVSRNRAVVAGCPNWSVPSQPNYQNYMMSNFGCAVNSNLAAMVANPTDLLHGRQGAAVSDAATAQRAIDLYRNWPLTAIIDGQAKRPLKEATTSESK